MFVDRTFGWQSTRPQVDLLRLVRVRVRIGARLGLVLGQDFDRLGDELTKPYFIQSFLVCRVFYWLPLRLTVLSCLIDVTKPQCSVASYFCSLGWSLVSNWVSGTSFILLFISDCQYYCSWLPRQTCRWIYKVLSGLQDCTYITCDTRTVKPAHICCRSVDLL